VQQQLTPVRELESRSRKSTRQDSEHYIALSIACYI
jgi:hypothetical protein